MLETTHIIDRVYGVAHGSYTAIGPFSIGETAIYPSLELEMDLRRLPKGTVVGIEDFDPKDIRRHTYNIDGQRFSIRKGSGDYWRQLRKICRQQGLKVAYLDSFSTFRGHVAKGFEASALVERFKAIEDPKVLREFNEEMFRLGTKASYIHEVEREIKIVEAMAQKKPQVAIIGLSHGDILTTDRKLLDQCEVAFGSYSREVAPEMLGLGESRSRRGVLLSDSKPDLTAILERESLVRSWHAINEGRILPTKTPDYMGSWDLDCSTRGLFEVYVNGQADGEPFSGVIEDILGTADFEGEINEGWVQFLKSYREGESSPEAVLGKPILYEGYFEDGKYNGYFSCSEGRDRPFVMNLGSRFLGIA